MAYLRHCYGACTGIAFVDATTPTVCRNQRIRQHKVFKGIAARGKSISHKFVARLLESSKVHLVTFARSNMAGRLLHHDDVLLLRKRVIIETINDQRKNISQIEHSRHRSPLNFVVNLLADLIAYCLQPKKPSLHLHQQPLLPVS